MKLVRLEPELEVIAGDLPAHSRFEMAIKLRRWAHQLEVTGKILARPRGAVVKRLKKLSIDRLKHN